MSAAPEDCPCCHECLAPGLDTDRALVSAFLGGAVSRDLGVCMDEALCARHAALARDCLTLVADRVSGPRS